MTRFFTKFWLLPLFLASFFAFSCRNESDGSVAAGKIFGVFFNSNAPEGVEVSGEMSPQIFYAGQEQALSECKFAVDDGWAFAGWARRPSGDVVFKDKEVISAASDMTLYARWAKAISVSFNPNAPEGATVSGEMSAQTFYAGLEQALPECQFAADGDWFFLGWAKRPDGDVVFIDQEVVFATEDLTLYAKWVKAIKVSFNPNAPDGVTVSGEMSAQTFFANQRKALSECGFFISDRWIFLGWAETSDGDVAYADKEAILATGDMTLYAKWAKALEVFFDKNAPEGLTVSGEMGSQVFVKDVPQNLSTCGYSLSGWKFMGWMKSAGGEVEFSDEEKIAVSADLPLYAKWAEIIEGTVDEIKDALNSKTAGEYYAIFTGGDCAGLYGLEGVYGPVRNNDNLRVHFDFSQLTSLEEISGSAFVNCGGVAGLILPGSLKKIGESAFFDCHYLKYVTFSDGIEEIGKMAFVRTSLKRITIPKTVTHIGLEAFGQCTYLKEATFENPAGWVRSEDEEFAESSPITEDLSNAEVAATCLKTTYCYSYWKRE